MGICSVHIGHTKIFLNDHAPFFHQARDHMFSFLRAFKNFSDNTRNFI